MGEPLIVSLSLPLSGNYSIMFKMSLPKHTVSLKEFSKKRIRDGSLRHSLPPKKHGNEKQQQFSCTNVDIIDLIPQVHSS